MVFLLHTNSESCNPYVPSKKPHNNSHPEPTKGKQFECVLSWTVIHQRNYESVPNQTNHNGDCIKSISIDASFDLDQDEMVRRCCAAVIPRPQITEEIHWMLESAFSLEWNPFRHCVATSATAAATKLHFKGFLFVHCLKLSAGFNESSHFFIIAIATFDGTGGSSDCA